jgi:hypothetical protein
MIIASHQAGARSRSRRRSRTVAVPALIGLALLLPVSACGSSGSAATSATSAASGTSATSGTSAAQQTCQRVSTVLTNGPDPDADPVGYAEAQILQLRQVRTADATLGQAITGLADAYSGYSAANGTSKTAKATLTAAINRINSLCPGAGATP